MQDQGQGNMQEFSIVAEETLRRMNACPFPRVCHTSHEAIVPPGGTHVPCSFGQTCFSPCATTRDPSVLLERFLLSSRAPSVCLDRPRAPSSSSYEHAVLHGTAFAPLYTCLYVPRWELSSCPPSGSNRFYFRSRSVSIGRASFQATGSKGSRKGRTLRRRPCAHL